MTAETHADTVDLAGLELTPNIPVQVADHLTELIVRGELAPGERIPEARITKALGVSRGSVRAAMQILEHRHLVELPPRRGALVTRLDEKRVRDLYDVVIPLYETLSSGAALAWKTADDLAPMYEVQEQLALASESSNALAFIEVSHGVADAACELTDNLYLTRMMHDLRPVFSRCFYRALTSGEGEFERLRSLVDDLIDSIERRDAAAVGQLLRDYGRHQRDIVLATL